MRRRTDVPIAVSGSGPGNPQQSPGACHADVEESPFLTDLLGQAGQDERQRPLMKAEQCDRVPFQTLCRMQRGDGDALRRWNVLHLGATVQLGRYSLQAERLLALLCRGF